MSHRKKSTGVETWYEYDTNGHLIHERTSEGYEHWYEYDANGNQIHNHNSDGKEWRIKYTYTNVNGKSLIEWKLSN